MVIGSLGKTIDISYGKKGSAPGKAILVKTTSAGGQERENEMYHNPGIQSAPTKKDRTIEIPIGTGARVIIASHNYRIEIDPDAGETIIYSTNRSGESIAAKIDLKNDGTIEMNGNDKSFVTHAELDAALQAFITALNTAMAAKLDGGGSSPALSIDISGAETTTVRTGG